jgi:hypothetical protein
VGWVDAAEVTVSCEKNWPRDYAYDENDNVTSDGTRAFAWDAFNRLASVGGAAFTYAPDGTRLAKTSPTGTTLYLGTDAERAPEPYE